MKPQELRIGNYIQGKSPEKTEYQFPVVLDKGYFKMFLDGDIHIKPLPLTEERLLKFGFEKIDHIGGYSFWSLIRKKRDIAPSICIYENYTTVGNNSSIKHIKYVHQLQNLYFALTNSELEINI